MKKIIIYLLRFSIIFLLFLPIFVPFVQEKGSYKNNSYVNILIPSNIFLRYEDKNKIQKLVSQNFGNDIKINYNIYGSIDNIPILDYEDILLQVSKAKTVTILISNSNLFGDDAKKFNMLLKNSDVYKENKFYFLPLKELPSFQTNENSYLVISNIFIPKISFLSEESIATIDIIGKEKPSTELNTEITLHSGNTFLNSKNIKLVVPKNGYINTSVNIPINFSRIGNQVITADITSPIAQSPMNSASTTVQVVYSKTTLLHIAVGPDWNLRSIRQKLKFWPNIDLLSYYILRSSNSDQSIPNSQLSLIEFPSDKLFGTSLQNFHGIVAQNFLFDTFLGHKESENLVSYVKNGGRLVIQGGPLSFLSENTSINSLYPCENKPEWNNDKTFHWESNNSDYISTPKFINSLLNIVTHYTALNCKPKKDAIVLAKTQEGNHPVLLAMPLQKGIVLSFLAGDWTHGYTKEEVRDVSDLSLRMREANSSEFIFNWMVEFLQRRQDSGIRAPDIAGPRIYENDKFLILKNNGDIQAGKQFTLEAKSKNSLPGSLIKLKFLEKEILSLQKSINNIANIKFKNKFISEPIELAIGIQHQNNEVLRFGTWPIFPSSAKKLEIQENPFLFDNIPNLNNENTPASNEANYIPKKIPLLIAFPWLLAFALFCLFIEQFLARIFWRKHI